MIAFMMFLPCSWFSARMERLERVIIIAFAASWQLQVRKPHKPGKLAAPGEAG
jgi:hypothetical protein